MGHSLVYRDATARFLSCTSMRVKLLLSLLALAASISVASVHARPFDDVIKSGKLTVFVYSDYAPYSFEQDGELTGIDVEVGRAFGDKLGVDVEFLVRGADENLDDDLRINVWKGDLIHRRAADVMLHVPVDREVDIRNEFVVITSPYFQEEMAVVYDKVAIPNLETFGSFRSRPIAVEVDTAGDFFLSGAFGGQLHASIRRGRTFADAAALYVNGDVNALLGSKAQAEWVANQAVDRDSGIAQPPMPGIVRKGWPIGIAIKHDSRDLGYALGDVLTELMNSGEMAKISARYGVDYVTPEQW